jgi:hypothetical protein
MRQQRHDEDEKLEQKRQQVLDLWNRRINWWNSAYAKGMTWVPEILHHMENRVMAMLEATDWANPVAWKDIIEKEKYEELERKRLAEEALKREAEEKERKRQEELIEAKRRAEEEYNR